MKTKFFIVLLMLIFVTFVNGCTKETEYVYEQDEDICVFPVSSYEETLEITMGDVMPFYDDGVMNIYHLQNSRSSKSSLFYHPISRLTTTDYLHYVDEGIVIPFEEDPVSPDAAIGTGSVIKDKNGLYHFFYTGHNANLKPFEVVRHAVSEDQKEWVKDESFNFNNTGCNDFRDPYVYYDKYDDMYYMLITTRVDDIGVIKRYGTKDLSVDQYGWEDFGVFFWNDSGSYNMECPSYVELNGYYYLAYSEQGDNRVTHYRYQTERNGEWKRFERDSIDASGFYAGRIEKAGKDLYAFAWCAGLTGGFVGEFDWGGNLVAHKLVQSENGELNAVMIDSVYETLSNEVEYKTLNQEVVTNIGFKGDLFESVCFEKLGKSITRMNFKISANDLKGDFGVTLNVNKADNRLGSAVIAFDLTNNKVSCYHNVSNIIRYGDVLATVDFEYEKDKEYEVDIIIEGEVLVVYLNSTVAVTARMPGIKNKNFAFYSNNVSASIYDIKFYI